MSVSVLYREPKLLKVNIIAVTVVAMTVSVLYREPKLLKVALLSAFRTVWIRFQCSTVSRNC